MSKPTKFDGMMYEYCVGLGYCGGTVDGEPRNVRHRIPKEGVVSAVDFAKWLLWAEGFNPEEREYRRRLPELERIFIKHMGDNFASASLLVDRD